MNYIQNMDNMIKIPKEILFFEIFRKVNFRLVLVLICKEWYNIIKEFADKPTRSRIDRYFKYLGEIGSISFYKWANYHWYDGREYFEEDFLKSGIKSGHLDIVKLANKRIIKENLDVIAERGHIHIIKYLHSKGYELTENLCDGAALGNHSELVTWLIENNCPFEQKTFNNLALNGNLTLIKEFYSVEDLIPICHNAASSGHKHIIEWAMDRGYKLQYSNIAEKAALKGHFDLMKWAVDNGEYLGPNAINACAEYGDLELYKWLYSNFRIKDYQNTLHYLALFGKLDIIQWLCQKNRIKPKGLILWAAEGNHFNVAKWSYENGDIDCQETAKFAAQNDNFEMLKWLVDRGSIVELDDIIIAIKNNNLPMLKFIHKITGEMHDDAVWRSFDTCNMELIDYVIDNSTEEQQLYYVDGTIDDIEEFDQMYNNINNPEIYNKYGPPSYY